MIKRAMIVLTHCSLTVMMWTNNEEQFLLDDLVRIELYPARALRALGLLLADSAPTVEGGKTF